MKKAFVFDFDDTLATTDCRVSVRRNSSDKKLYSLTAEEYNSHRLSADEFYDYSEFIKLINPQKTFIMALALEVHQEGHPVYILTARGSAAQEAIDYFMQLNGIKCKEIICVGDSGDQIEQEKRKAFMTIMENYDKLYFYDDFQGNIDAIPHSDKVRKYLVQDT
ncbi:MAG: hypothetical protein GY880_29890 [Planctomycetaceae bacterium]|nr:hypothetical protein [Planctomycetaceae bacterium]